MNALFIISSQETIDTNVYSYKEVGGKIYVFGEKGYTVLDIKTKKYIQHKNIEEFNRSQKEILSKLKKVINK